MANENNENPGVIASEKSLTLHTKEALKIFKGRRADPENDVREIAGLPIYATMLKNIWRSCLAGDVYAVWWIQKIEKVIHESESDLNKLIKEIDDLTKPMSDRIDLSRSEATNPIKVQINYASPYMYKVIYLLIDIDRIISKMLTLKHMAIISPAAFDQYRKNVTGTMNRTLLTFRGFKPTGVTAEDIKENNAKAKEAFDAMGKLPDLILAEEYKPEFFPTRSKVKILGFKKPTEKKGV